MAEQMNGRDIGPVKQMEGSTGNNPPSQPGGSEQTDHKVTVPISRVAAAIITDWASI